MVRSTRSTGAAQGSRPLSEAHRDVELVDYKVRILQRVRTARRLSRACSSKATTRHTGERWTTVGVSPNIIDASFEALLDSINYKLFRDGAEAA